MLANYCDKPYDRNHKCKFKEPQLFTVEITGNGVLDVSDSNEGGDEFLDIINGVILETVSHVFQ